MNARNVMTMPIVIQNSEIATTFLRGSFLPGSSGSFSFFFFSFFFFFLGSSPPSSPSSPSASPFLSFFLSFFSFFFFSFFFFLSLPDSSSSSWERIASFSSAPSCAISTAVCSIPRSSFSPSASSPTS